VTGPRSPAPSFAGLVVGCDSGWVSSVWGTIGRTVLAVPLFEVDKDTKEVAEIQPTTFPDLKLWERQDLEAWADAHCHSSTGALASTLGVYVRKSAAAGRPHRVHPLVSPSR
jgi:hypothetical protein